MRTIRILKVSRAGALRALPLLLAAAASAPSPAWPHPPSHPPPAPPPAETIAEAMFLCDPLPPGGRDLNLAVAVAPVVDPVTGARAFASTPRLQLAMGLGERLGFTADVGLGTNGAALDTPGASLKLLLRAPEPGRTGLALSADLFGGTRDLSTSEAGLGLGAIRAVGPVTLRASASIASPVVSWAPHAQGGVSAALALGSRWRVLGEVVGTTDGRNGSLAAGPTAKVALSETSSLAAGVLVPLAAEPPTFTIQVTHGI
jgi:hypothetical protein